MDWILSPPLWLLLIYIEFKKIATVTSIGFLLMGFIGYFVKLVHIPSTCESSFFHCVCALITFI